MLPRRREPLGVDIVEESRLTTEATSSSSFSSSTERFGGTPCFVSKWRFAFDVEPLSMFTMVLHQSQIHTGGFSGAVALIYSSPWTHTTDVVVPRRLLGMWPFKSQSTLPIGRVSLRRDGVGVLKGRNKSSAETLGVEGGSILGIMVFAMFVYFC